MSKVVDVRNGLAKQSLYDVGPCTASTWSM